MMGEISIMPIGGIPENISGIRKGRHQAFVAIPEIISGIRKS